METNEPYQHQKPRRRKQLLENVRQRIKPLSKNANDLISRVIRAHVPQARFTMMLSGSFEDTEEIERCMLDGKYVITMRIPYPPGLIITEYLLITGIPRYPGWTVTDIHISLEEAGEYCRKDGHHDQWLWAAVQEMRAMAKPDPPAFSDDSSDDDTESKSL